MSPTNYRQLCIEIFGTDDEATIRKLVEAWKKKNNRNAGRKRPSRSGTLRKRRRCYAAVSRSKALQTTLGSAERLSAKP